MSKCPIERDFVINVPFEEWAKLTGREIHASYVRSNKFFNNFHYLSLKNKRKTIFIDLKNQKAGIATCRSCDEFNELIGIAIAFYRMMDWELPKMQKTITKHLTELKKGDKMFDFERKNINHPTLEYVDFYRNRMILWDMDKNLFRSITPKDGQSYKVLEEK